MFCLDSSIQVCRRCKSSFKPRSERSISTSNVCAEYGLVLLAPSSGLDPAPSSYLIILTLAALRLKFRGGGGEGKGESSQETCSRNSPLIDSERAPSLLTTVVTERQASVLVPASIVPVCLLSSDLFCVVDVVPTVVRS